MAQLVIVLLVGNNSNGNTTDSNVPVATSTLPGGAVDIASNLIFIKLQFAEKTQATCSAQTGFADVTGSTSIAFNDNTSVANAASITSNVNDPIATSLSVPQTYHEAVGTITDPNVIAGGKQGLWDISLTANNASQGSSYCLRFVSASGAALGQYSHYPEVSIASASTGPTLEQKTRGGQAVVDGIKSPYSF